jgi:uncharacterized Zn finger protein (UPF0148 family)
MTTIPCPFCNSPIPIDSTICVRCGKQGGERLERVRNAVIEEEEKARAEIEREEHEIKQRRVADNEKRQARIRKRANDKEKLLVFAKTPRVIVTVFSGLLVLVILGVSLTNWLSNPFNAALLCGDATLTTSGVKVSQDIDDGILLAGKQVPGSDESVACVWKTLGLSEAAYYSMRSSAITISNNRQKHGDFLVSVSSDEKTTTWFFVLPER